MVQQGKYQMKLLPGPQGWRTRTVLSVSCPRDDSDVGMGGALLSGGQRQRVAIARMLMSNPDYLLMDEAGASLDHKSDMTIFRTVREHMKNRTIVVVAHDMRSVMEADHIIVLNEGSLEAAGNHKELLGTSPTYRP